MLSEKQLESIVEFIPWKNNACSVYHFQEVDKIRSLLPSMQDVHANNVRDFLRQINGSGISKTNFKQLVSIAKRYAKKLKDDDPTADMMSFADCDAVLEYCERKISERLASNNSGNVKFVNKVTI